MPQHPLHRGIGLFGGGRWKILKLVLRPLRANQREDSTTLREHTTRLDRLEAQGADTNARVRSLEEGQAEIKDLLVRALDK